MAEEKIPKIKTQSDQLSDSNTPDEEAMNTINHPQIVDSIELGKDDIPELVDNDTGEKSENNMEQYI